jgi:hypothetical protein
MATNADGTTCRANGTTTVQIDRCTPDQQIQQRKMGMQVAERDAADRRLVERTGPYTAMHSPRRQAGTTKPSYTGDEAQWQKQQKREEEHRAEKCGRSRLQPQLHEPITRNDT